MKKKTAQPLLSGLLGVPESAATRYPDLQQIFQAYQARQPRIDFGPPVIYLEAVTGCPFTCIMCKPEPTSPQKVSSELLKRLEPSFPGLEILAIHGQGDPLLADLEYFVYQSLKHNFCLHTETNGFLLTDQTVDLLLKTRLSVVFWLPAARPETYYRLTGLELNRVKDNIKNLVEKSRRVSIKPDLRFSFTVMKENLPEIEDFLQLASECGISRVRFIRLWPGNDTSTGVRLRGLTFKYSEQTNPEVERQFSDNFPVFTSLASDLRIKIERGEELDNYNSRAKTMGEIINSFSRRLSGKRLFPLAPARGICAAPWFGQLSVSFNGEVLPCCRSSTILGNLNESSLEDIWHGPLMTRIRQSFHNSRYPRECEYCRGYGINAYPDNSFPGVRR